MYDRYGRQVEDPISSRAGVQSEVPRTPLTSPAALYALTYLIGDHVLVDRVVHRYQSWEALSSASAPDLAFTVGTWAAQLRIPTTCPPLPDLGTGVQVKSRYEEGYPSGLGDLLDAPVLLYHLGELPTEPLLAVGGTYFPSAAGLVSTRDAARAAVSQGIPVLAALDSGCGHAALEETVERHGRAVAVASGDLSNPASNSVLIRRILDNGGAVVSEWGPREPWSEDRTFASARLVAAMAAGVVLAELGMHPTGGAHLARSAIFCGRYLIVPAPRADAELQVNADGLVTLARPRSFSEKIYGTHPRMQARLRAGYSPADAVVTSRDELAEAISLACAPEASKGSSRR